MKQILSDPNWWFTSVLVPIILFYLLRFIDRWLLTSSLKYNRFKLKRNYKKARNIVQEANYFTLNKELFQIFLNERIRSLVLMSICLIVFFGMLIIAMVFTYFTDIVNIFIEKDVSTSSVKIMIAILNIFILILIFLIQCEMDKKNKILIRFRKISNRRILSYLKSKRHHS